MSVLKNSNDKGLICWNNEKGNKSSSLKDCATTYRRCDYETVNGMENKF